MLQLMLLLALASFLPSPVICDGIPTAPDIGPAAFLWPPDRVWGRAQDNTPPCGSSAGVANRTDFPLTNGKVSIVLQDESYDIALAVSYAEDPKKNEDFKTIVSAKEFPELEPGHECNAIPNPPDNIKAGANATLQISYVSMFDGDKNETFYACADITYVPLTSFKENGLCFNFSGPALPKSSTGTTTSTTTSSATEKSSSSSHSSSNGNEKGFSAGDVAGISVGVMGGTMLLSIAAFFLWRRRQRKAEKNQTAAIRLNDLKKPYRT